MMVYQFRGKVTDKRALIGKPEYPIMVPCGDDAAYRNDIALANGIVKACETSQAYANAVIQSSFQEGLFGGPIEVRIKETLTRARLDTADEVYDTILLPTQQAVMNHTKQALTDEFQEVVDKQVKEIVEQTSATVNQLTTDVSSVTREAERLNQWGGVSRPLAVLSPLAVPSGWIH